jgi:hypothetical protein
MEGLYEIPRKLIHKEPQSKDLDILSYEDIQNISRNMHKERSTKMLPITTHIAETHEALNVVEILTSSQEQLLLIHGSEKNTEVFPCKPTYSTLTPLVCFPLTGHSNQHRSFTTNYLQFMDSATITMCHLHFTYWPINIKRSMMMCSDIEYQRLQHLLQQQLFMLTSKLPFPKQ